MLLSRFTANTLQIASPLLSCNNHHLWTWEGSMVHTQGHAAIIQKFDNSWNTIITRLATSDHHGYGYHMAWTYDVAGECYLIANRYQISNLWHLRDCSTTHIHKGHSNSHTAMNTNIINNYFVCYLFVLWQIGLHLVILTYWNPHFNSFGLSRQHWMNYNKLS